MFLRKFARTNYVNRILLPDCNCYKVQQVKFLCGTNNRVNKHLNRHINFNRYANILPTSCTLRFYSKKLVEDAFRESENEKEFNKIKEIFSQPRATLNQFATKTPQKIFDIHYKQTVTAPKGGKKKNIQNDWICTYTFIWPEKIKFESTAISKGKAADKAATQALYWLYKSRRIDDRGCPVYDKTVLSEIQSRLNKDIFITISQSSAERIDRVWNDYENEIKKIYEATFEEANKKLLYTSPTLKKDSTIDDQDCAEDMMENEVEKIDTLTDAQPTIHPVFGKHVEPIQSALERRQRTLEQTFKRYNDRLTPLPIDEYADQITSTLERSRVLVIVGAAGCGKSTRVPAAVLRHCGADTTAIVSEPRRVAAIGLAQRVAEEMGEQVGDSVGYQVRLHSKLPRPPGGAILYCTSGVLLRRLQMNPGLEGCSHVFIDEAHERDVNTDVALLLLKRALDVNPDLRIVVMSATLDTAVFTNYFNDCPIIEVPGKTYPVEISNLEDIEKKFNLKLPSTLESCTRAEGKPQINCQEIVEVIKAIDKTQSEGAILVFLPGWAEIKQTKLLLDELYANSPLHLVLPVHSRLSTTEQAKMFSRPPAGVRKLVLATNVAETSVTIPDAVHVLDAGAQRENRIREGSGSASLETVWVSQAGAKQRAGRAGRVQPGHCYRMYTKDKEMELIPHTTPEILRIPLEQTVLDCKSYAQNDKVESFLSQLPEPPSKQAIRFAVNDLIDLGALTPSEQMTRLGVLLSHMPLHPRLARCVLTAATLGNVLPAANVATHCAENVDLFRNSAERRDEIREIKSKFNPTSDHAAVHWIQDEFEQALEEKGWGGIDEWCDRYGIRKDRLNFVRSLTNHHLEHLIKTGLVERTLELPEMNRFSHIDELTSAVLLSGSNSILVTRKHVKTKGKLKTAVSVFTSKGEKAHIGSESVNYGIAKRKLDTQLLTYFGGHHSAERRALVVYRSSLIPPHTALLFSTGSVKQNLMDVTNGETTELYLPRHNLKIQMPTSQAELILKAREMLQATLKYYIERDLRNVEFDVITTTSRFKTRLVKTLGRILVEAEKECIQNTDTVR